MGDAGALHPHPVINYKLITKSRIYTNSASYFISDPEIYKKYEIIYGKIENYKIFLQIGSGKYSTVYLGRCKYGLCAIKVLKEVDFDIIRRELFILHRVSGIPGIVKFIDVVRDPRYGYISLITEAIISDPPSSLYPSLTLDEIRYYIYILLQTLDSCHKRGVMHRDVKPGNFLISRKCQSARLIDWGLSDLYFPNRQYTVRVSTLRYKAPELLIGYHHYDYGVDIWGAGCILGSMLIGTNFLNGETPQDVFTAQVDLIGSESFSAYLKKLGIPLPPELDGSLNVDTEDSWKSASASIRSSVRDQDAVDLLKRLLVVDHSERITAREALEHPFFATLFA